MKLEIGQLVHATRSYDINADNIIFELDEDDLQIVDIVGIILHYNHDLDYDPAPVNIKIIRWNEKPSDWWDKVWVSKKGITVLDKNKHPEYFI